jgi:hypothetical protein
VTKAAWISRVKRILHAESQNRVRSATGLILRPANRQHHLQKHQDSKDTSPEGTAAGSPARSCWVKDTDDDQSRRDGCPLPGCSATLVAYDEYLPPTPNLQIDETGSPEGSSSELSKLGDSGPRLYGFHALIECFMLRAKIRVRSATDFILRPANRQHCLQKHQDPKEPSPEGTAAGSPGRESWVLHPNQRAVPKGRQQSNAVQISRLRTKAAWIHALRECFMRRVKIGQGPQQASFCDRQIVNTICKGIRVQRIQVPKGRPKIAQHDSAGVTYPDHDQSR